jgi:hypothetical protein
LDLDLPFHLRGCHFQRLRLKKDNVHRQRFFRWILKSTFQWAIYFAGFFRYISKSTFQ